jgi:chaperonin cofactor prefoldin
VSEERSPERRTFGKVLGGILRWLLRLLVVLIIGAVLGVGLFFGGIYLYQQYVQPVQVHAIRLDVLEARQEQVAERLTERLDDVQERVRGLEAQQDQDRQALARLEAQIAAAVTAQAAQATRLDRLTAIGSDLAALQAALAQVEEAQQALRADAAAVQESREATQADLEATQADLKATQADLEALQQDLQALGEELDATASGLDAIEAEINTVSEAAAEQSEVVTALQQRLSGELSPEALLRATQMLEAMDLLTRSRLLLVQNNVGLARTDIAAARERMLELQPTAPTDQQDAIEEIVTRLDAALDALPQSPVAAADALEGAWQLLLAGLPSGAAAGAEAEETVAPAEGTPTAEASPTVEGTPTAEATPTETEATPTVEATPTPQS